MTNPFHAIKRGVTAWAKNLACDHVGQMHRVRVIIADQEIRQRNGRRSEWRCARCGAIEYSYLPSALEFDSHRAQQILTAQHDPFRKWWL